MSNQGIQVEVNAAITNFRFNEAGYQLMLKTDVGKDLARRAIAVESSAKRRASGRPGPNVITGRLRGSITWRLGEENGEPYADVGTSVEYAPYVERLYPFLLPALEDARL